MLESLIDTLVSWDRTASLALNSLNCPASDAVWIFFSEKLVWVPLYLFVLVMLYRQLGWKRATAATVGIVLVIVACDQVANLFKDGVCRPRPCWDEWMIANGIHLPQGCGSPYGFFSGHAANVFGFATASSLCFGMKSSKFNQWYRPLIFLWAILVALSRVFLGMHFLGDITVGALEGILFGWFIGLAVCKAADRYLR